MSVQQFKLYVAVTKTGKQGRGIKYEYEQIHQVNLVDGNIAEFLAKLTDVGAVRFVWLSIADENGQIAAFADGTERNGKQLDSVEIEGHRYQAKLFAERLFQRLQDTDGTD